MAEAVDTAATSWVGKPCPKCGYVRTALDANAAWQCPRCQIAYAKFVAAAAAPIHERVAAHAGAMAERAGSDHSLAGLIATNLFALVLAWYTGMTLYDLMFVYWIQSVVIGVTSTIRILKLHRFATDGVGYDGRPVAETAPSKGKAAGLFAVQYGFAHVIYLFFIALASKGEFSAPLGTPLCALTFVASHGFSLYHNLESDAAGRPNIGKLMSIPFMRILPMHLIFVTGGILYGDRPYALFIFGALKTVIDAVMHAAEHHLMAQGAAQDETAPPSAGRPPSTAA